MKRSTTRWTTAMAAAALIALPAVGSAQPPSPSPTEQTPATAAPQTESTAQTPADHLKLAKSALDSVSKKSLPADARSKIDEPDRHLDSLEGEASSGAATSATATETQKWQTDLASAKQVLDDLIGPESAAAAEPTGTTGTTGAATIDEATKDNLRTVREQLNKFAEAMNRGPESAPSEMTPSTEPSAQPPTTEPTAPPTTEPSQPPTTEPSAQPPTTEPGAQPPAGAAPQADEQAARQHLSAAREALSQVTSMPEAQQLQGEARTQVSQLISNFNELITAESNWPAAYAKVEANLTTLLGPAGSDESAQPSDPTAAPESGAVGTSGASAVQIDPKIRAKLQEVRQQLKQFEQAAGGATGTPAATPNPSASTPSATSPTESYPTSPSTTPPSATDPSMAQAGQAGAGQQAEIQRHLDAIASIVNQALGSSARAGGTQPSTTEPGQPTGTSGSQTISLDRAQLEQIKTHLDQIQELLRQSGR
jgi:hypothetical protein